jgi:AbrB family looped-hinge helix DNA binding protein
MEQVTISPEGSIEIPKEVREQLDLPEGTKLTLEVRGHQIVISKDDSWEELYGAAGPDLMDKFIEYKKREREREDSRP